MTQTIKISSKEMALINDLLNLTEDEIYQKYGYKRDETIVHTAKFPNGIEADIKLVICEEESPYTEGVLFHNGFELTHTDPDCTYDGEWNFEHNGTEYTVLVEEEKEIDITNGKNNLGLTEERYQQLMSVFEDEKTVEEAVKTWGVEECNKGYTIFNSFTSNKTGILEVCMIDELQVFENDAAAVAQAIKDGIKFIPVEELPENFDRRYLGWIDTPENRKCIEEYCAEMENDSRDL